MAKSSIDIAELLTRLSAATIFEPRGEWRRLHRAPIDDDLASLIARAAATPNMFLAVRDDCIDAVASRLGVRRDYVAVLVRLSYLSPEIVDRLLAGGTGGALLCLQGCRRPDHPHIAQSLLTSCARYLMAFSQSN